MVYLVMYGETVGLCSTSLRLALGVATRNIPAGICGEKAGRVNHFEVANLFPLTRPSCVPSQRGHSGM